MGGGAGRGAHTGLGLRTDSPGPSPPLVQAHEPAETLTPEPRSLCCPAQVGVSQSPVWGVCTCADTVSPSLTLTCGPHCLQCPTAHPEGPSLGPGHQVQHRPPESRIQLEENTSSQPLPTPEGYKRGVSRQPVQSSVHPWSHNCPEQEGDDSPQRQAQTQKEGHDGSSGLRLRWLHFPEGGSKAALG